MVHGLGVGVPPSSGFPLPLFTRRLLQRLLFPLPLCGASAYPYDPYAPSAPLADEDERFPDGIPNPLDPSAPPLSLDSARSEYRRMIDYVCWLFPQRRVCLPLLLLRMPCLNRSLLQRLRRPRLLISIGLTVCGLLWMMRIVMWLRSWLLALLSAYSCLSV